MVCGKVSWRKGHEGALGFLQHSHIPILLPTAVWPWAGLLTGLGPVFPSVKYCSPCWAQTVCKACAQVVRG